MLRPLVEPWAWALQPPQACRLREATPETEKGQKLGMAMAQVIRVQRVQQTLHLAEPEV